MRYARTFFALMLFINAPTAFCLNRYVDGADGDDANDGLTLATAWATIQHSFDLAQPGDSVFIRGGNYTEHLVMNVTGLPGQRIWFGEYAEEQVEIHGDPSLGPTMLRIEDVSHITIKGLRLSALAVADAQGILIRCTPDGSVSDISLEYVRVENIDWTTSPGAIPGPDDNAQPIIVYGEGGTAANAITSLVLDNCVVNSCNTGYSEALSLDGNITGALIRTCMVTNNTNIGILVAGGYGVCGDPALDNVRNTIISECWVNRCVSNYATSAGIYVDGADSILVIRCRASLNGYGYEVGCEEDGEAIGVRIIDCQADNNLGAGLAIGGYDAGTTGQVTGALIRNNDFYNNDSLREGSGELYMTKAVDCVFRNNIFFTNDQHVLMTREDIAPQNGNTFDHDVWFTPGSDPLEAETDWGGSTLLGYDTFTATSGWEAQGFYADPLLMSATPNYMNFALQTGSPCIDAGDPATMIMPEEPIARLLGPFIDIGMWEAQLPQSVPHMQEALVTIGPNPCGSELFFSPAPERALIRVLDGSGRTVLGWSLLANGRLDTSDLLSGMYLVGVHAPGANPVYERVVKH